MVIVFNKSKNEKQIDSYAQLKSSNGVLLKIHFRIFSAEKKITDIILLLRCLMEGNACRL